MWLVAIMLGEWGSKKKGLYFISLQLCFMNIKFCGCNLVSYRIKRMFIAGEILPLKVFLGLLQHREKATEALKLSAIRQMQSYHRMFWEVNIPSIRIFG